MIRTVHLHGPLAARYGADPIRLNADDWPRLLAGLQSAFPDFRRTLGEFDEMALLKKRGDNVQCITPENLGWNFGTYPEIHINVGRKGAGVEVAAISFMSYTGWAAVAAYVIVNIAIALAISFVMKSLASTPQTSEGEQVDKRESNLFNGPANVNQQGHPVPLVFGTFKVGSVTVSTEVANEKQSISMQDYVSLFAGQTKTGNVLSNDLQLDPLTITSFTVDGVTNAAGSPIVGANYTVNITPAGAYTVTAYGSWSGEFGVRYSAAGTTTAVTTSTLTVQVYPTYVDTFGD